MDVRSYCEAVLNSDSCVDGVADGNFDWNIKVAIVFDVSNTLRVVMHEE